MQLLFLDESGKIDQGGLFALGESRSATPTGLAQGAADQLLSLGAVDEPPTESGACPSSTSRHCSPMRTSRHAALEGEPLVGAGARSCTARVWSCDHA